MCGIAGYIGPDTVNGRALLTQMAQALIHRGPDGEGQHVANFANGTCQVGLAHRRLAIIDLASGAQPIANENGRISVVFNGEIYNYRALRAQLQGRGHRFATESDTETIVHAYEEFGFECLQHLRGMFALALWDAEREQLFLARDRYGEKPLFYAQFGQTLVFASEIKALFEWPQARPEIDRGVLPQYLQYRYVPGPATLIKGIRKLMPGCMGVWKNGNWAERRYYWPPDGRPPVRANAAADVRENFLAKLDETVALMMASDVPFGAFLSGGLDSSSIVALMARHSSTPIKTFSVGFREGGYSELPYAAEVAREFRTDHHELIISAREVIDMLPRAARFRDAPVAEPADVPIFLLASAARRSVKMVLTGEGSDETLGGYPKHAFERFSANYQRIPRAVRRELFEPIVNALPFGAQRLKTAANAMGVERFEDRMPRWFGALSVAQIEALCGRAPAAMLNGASYPFESAADNSPLRRILYFDQASWLPDNLLERGDRMTMAASVEARLPFMDHELIEFISAQPDEQRIGAGTGKRLLREATAALVPRVVLQRRKSGFRMPIHLWLRHQMRPLLFDTLLGTDSRSAVLMDRTRIARYVFEHIDGRQNHEKLLWMLLNFEIWARESRVSL